MDISKNYIKTFTESLFKNKIKVTSSENQVLSLIFRLIEYNKAIFNISKSNIERVSSDLEFKSSNTVRDIITSCVKKGILIRVRRARYLLNPNYFFRGAEDKRVYYIELLKSGNFLLPNFEDDKYYYTIYKPKIEEKEE